MSVSDAAIAARVTALEAELATKISELNTMFLLWAACLVFLMQAGFALLSAGSIRAKNVKNILLKSCLDACLGGAIFVSRTDSQQSAPSSMPCCSRTFGPMPTFSPSSLAPLPLYPTSISSAME